MNPSSSSSGYILVSYSLINLVTVNMLTVTLQVAARARYNGHV